MDNDDVLILFILIGAVMFLTVVLYANNSSTNVNQAQDTKDGIISEPANPPNLDEQVVPETETQTPHCSIYSIYCNGKCYDPCPTGQKFDCPASGNANCLPMEAEKSSITTSESSENVEPYLGLFCDKINPYDIEVRKAASEAVKRHPGSYNYDQLLDIYDWVRENIEYINVPASLSAPYQPAETLATKSGDCKNQAALIASMVESIGGSAKIVIVPECSHSYTIVFFAKPDSDMSNFVQGVANHYRRNVMVHWYTDSQGIWMIFDPAGGTYPGDTLPNCLNKTIYTITSCLTCSFHYPNMPYTYGDKCYSACPSGTISANSYACAACPKGYYSFNNECVTCPEGYFLATDGKCYQK